MMESRTGKGLVASTACLVAVPIWWIVRHYFRERKLKYPPGPKGVFFFGNVLDFPDPSKGNIVEQKLLEWSMDYGLFYTVTLPIRGRLVVVMDPELVKKAFVTKNYSKSKAYQVLTPLFGNRSMLLLNSEEWGPHRRAFNPGFTPSFLKTMVSTMVEKLDRFISCIEEDIDNGKATHTLQRAQTFTSDVIVSVAFGEDWGGKKPHQARAWITELCTLLAGSFTDPLFLLFGSRFKPKIRHYESMFNQEMCNILERRLAANSQTSNAEAKDICSIAIAQMKGVDGTLSKEDKEAITHQLKTFYLAGHDTTASLISWTLWLLSQNNSVLEKVRQESRKVGLWINPNEPPNYDQLQKCVYLDAVLKETLRLYPPATFLTRHNSDKSHTYKGYTIGGCDIGVNIYGMHRHPALWKEPNIFRPERFLDQSEGDISYKYLAFSRGPRDCIGKHFAMLEAKLAVSSLSLRYNLECVDPKDRLIVRVASVPCNGAQVKFSRSA